MKALGGVASRGVLDREVQLVDEIREDFWSLVALDSSEKKTSAS